MISLIKMILNLFKRDKEIKIRRLPPRKVMRYHQLGLTFGLLCAFLAIVINYSTNFAGFPWYIPVLLWLIFLVGSCLGGLFLVAVVVFVLFWHNLTGIWEVLLLISKWYLGGYLFGAIFAILYNDLVFLHLLLFDKQNIKTVFSFDTSQKINIIKSPHEDEITVPIDRSERLYDFKLDNLKLPKAPYTIAFIANPQILCHDKDPKKKGVYEIDPIINQLDLFLRSVDRALASFERNEVLGCPEIWPYVRIITIFDESLKTMDGEKCCLVQSPSSDIEIDSVVAENLLLPDERMFENYQKIIDELALRADPKIKKIIDYLRRPDVIFALSAVPEFERSNALYSQEPDKNPTGKIFQFLPVPYPDEEFNSEKICNKESEIVINSDLTERCRHEYYAQIPGLVALNVLGANNRTYIHEFAHAMSSLYCGAIVDEYFDRLVVLEQKPLLSPEDKDEFPFFVNRIQRISDDNPGNKSDIIPVHKIFARYNCIDYFSDRDHPSGREHWRGYFPERITPLSQCIMDRYHPFHCFDRLISDFMYDRLITKIKRPAL